ncbi:MAG: tRNA (adenosine(37)-N6)-threonylcarbamoyltransferase complex dimerization subunit type 1 TsaB [Alphaproteobacteria bacterium]
MIILGLDTTGRHCTAALIHAEGADTQNCLAQKSENIGRGHAERLAPMVQEILREADITPPQIDRIAVCTGPGSFTGLRVALAFAKGFALPHNIPVIGISALEVIATQIDPQKEKKVVSVMDVRRGQVCWAAYDKGREIQPPVTEDLETAKAAIAAFGYDKLSGDGAHLIETESSVQHVSGPSLAFLAKDLAPKDYPSVPLYSRGPDAKLPGGITPKLPPL